MNKPILYCSENCLHSKELLQHIESKSIADNFQVYIIEKEEKGVPSFIDRVPLLFHNNKILYDEGLFMYIKSINSKTKKVNAFTVESSISDTYSFIDKQDGLEHSYLNVNSAGNFEDQKIETPPESSETNNSSVSLEELISNRGKEITA